MPSSNKTSHLSLNYWQGTDKPKRDDFNADNTLLDAACKTLATDVAALGAAQESFKTSTNSTLSSLNSRCDTINGNLNTHIGNAVSHITAAERTAWNNLLTSGGDVVVGTYTGTGAATLKVTMGFKPKFGFLFLPGYGVVECTFATEQTSIYSAYFSSQGCSRNVAVESDGITVTHTTANSITGNYYYYNLSGKTYIYVAWKS